MGLEKCGKVAVENEENLLLRNCGKPVIESKKVLKLKHVEMLKCRNVAKIVEYGHNLIFACGQNLFNLFKSTDSILKQQIVD